MKCPRSVSSSAPIALWLSLAVFIASCVARNRRIGSAMWVELGDQDRHPVAERALLLRAHRHRHADDRRNRGSAPPPRTEPAHAAITTSLRMLYALLIALQLGQRERLPHHGAIGRDAAVERRARRQRGRCLHHHPLLHRPADHRLVDGRRRVAERVSARPTTGARRRPRISRCRSVLRRVSGAPSHAERGARQQLGRVRDTRSGIQSSSTSAGGHLRRPIEQDRRSRPCRTRRGVVEEQDHRHPAAFQAMDEMDVPQRPAPVERLARQARRELGRAGGRPRVAQRHLREVVVEIEVGILDPVDGSPSPSGTSSPPAVYASAAAGAGAVRRPSAASPSSVVPSGSNTMTFTRCWNVVRLPRVNHVSATVSFCITPTSPRFSARPAPSRA